jgi:hypothetical protein
MPRVRQQLAVIFAIGSAGFVSEGSLARGSGPIAVELIAWFPE